MDGKLIDFRQLTYFLEVAKQSSFSRAGQKLHLSQPTLSKMVKNLEEELKVTLFDRSTRRVQLTDAGEVVLQHAQNVIKSFENLHAALSDLTEIKSGNIKLGLPPVIGASFFPRLIARYRSLYPQITIQLIEEGGKQIEQSLLEGSIDLGVVVLPVDEELFETLPLVERQLMLVIHPKHPLAGRKEVSLSELREEPFIMFREGFSLYDRVREACIREGFEAKIAYESSQWDFISETVAANLGISLLPETICRKLHPDEVTVIPKVNPPIRWNLALVWRKQQYLSHAARSWIDFVRDEFQNKP